MEVSEPELKKFAQNLHMIVLPCTLWAVHVDPMFNYIAVIHLDVTNFTKLNIDKGILLTSNNNSIKASVFISNGLIDIPNFVSDIRVVSDLANLIYAMHDLRVCVNSDNYVGFPNCLKYIGMSFSNVCSSCASERKTISAACSDRENIFENKEQKIENICCINNEENILNKDLNLNVDSTDITRQLILHDDQISNSKCSYDLCQINTMSDPHENTASRNADYIECNDIFHDIERNVEQKSTSKTFCCNLCNKYFNTKSQLKNHVRLHTGEKPYICTVCNKASNQKSSHKRHMLTHSGIKPNLCNICGKTFCIGYRMEDHMLIHTNEKPFECGVCKKTFSKNYNLKLHKKTHTGERPYVCSSCGKTYTTKSNLKTHIMSIHSNKKPHSCNSCNMSFVHPRLLKIHMRKHTGEKPYKCSMCSKAFPKKIHLTIHTRFHTGEKPHVCSFCGKGFTTTGNLSSHKKVHHKGNL